MSASSKYMGHLLPILQGSEGSTFASTHDGWDNSTNVCNWHGVTCDSAGVITMLSLTNSELAGTIPPSLGKVTSLTHLYLGSNAFDGKVPKEVASLPYLQQIDLSFNKLNGTIPRFESSAMDTILLGHNQFTGTLPANTGVNLNKLRTFSIKYNRLRGKIPRLTASFPSLVDMDLSNNQFIGTIPGFLGSLTTLQKLYLSNNRLSGTIPIALTGSDLALEELYLHGNLLSGTLPASLADLPHLSVLFIDDNKLTGTVPKELCDLDLNEVFYHESNDTNVDHTYEEWYGNTGNERSLLVQASEITEAKRSIRLEEPTEERDGCTSIACPSGYRSSSDNNKDGIFPCEKCESQLLNPYIGSNRCFEFNQETVLKVFYQSTSGENWIGGKNWADETVSPCLKEGVTCNGNGQVTQIILPNMGLSGTLPDEIGFLSHLEEFNVSQNDIGGKLPADLRFAPLQMLDVSANRMTGYVPLGLCQKAGVNGNGLDGIFTCDTIACQPGQYSSIGRASPGASGIKCAPCSYDDSYLGSTKCSDNSNGALTPFGYMGEILLAVFAMGIVCVMYWMWNRASVATDYIKRSYGVAGGDSEESEGFTNPNDDPLDPLNGIDGVEAFPANIEVKIKDEWSSGRESAKEVWLDVPKIQ